MSDSISIILFCIFTFKTLILSLCFHLFPVTFFSCTLPWIINDVLNINDVAQIVQMAFEDGQVENMRGVFRCNCPPIMTCNTDVIADASANTRYGMALTMYIVDEAGNTIMCK